MNNGELSLDQASDKAVASYNRSQRDQIMELFSHQVAQIKTSKIAAVCLTDAETVTLLIKEFVAQLAHAAKQQHNLKINLKVGVLTIKAGATQFSQANRMYLQQPGATEPGSEFGSTRVSVATPSIAQSAAHSIMS